MDGFHLDNHVLDALGLRHRKGAPQTFDVAGLLALLARLQSEDVLYYPTFDRARDLSIAGSGQITAETTTVVVEGNYLLLDAPQWREIAGFAHAKVFLAGKGRNQ